MMPFTLRFYTPLVKVILARLHNVAPLQNPAKSGVKSAAASAVTLPVHPPTRGPMTQHVLWDEQKAYQLTRLASHELQQGMRLTASKDSPIMGSTAWKMDRAEAYAGRSFSLVASAPDKEMRMPVWGRRARGKE